MKFCLVECRIILRMLYRLVSTGFKPLRICVIYPNPFDFIIKPNPTLSERRWHGKSSTQSGKFAFDLRLPSQKNPSNHFKMDEVTFLGLSKNQLFLSSGFRLIYPSYSKLPNGAWIISLCGRWPNVPRRPLIHVSDLWPNWSPSWPKPFICLRLGPPDMTLFQSSESWLPSPHVLQRCPKPWKTVEGK